MIRFNIDSCLPDLSLFKYHGRSIYRKVFTLSLKEYFKRYLADVRGVSSSSVNHYLDAINWISKYLVNKGLLQASLYEILDLELLDQLTGILLKDSSFIEMNKRGHQMYTVGLNNYLRFAKGEGFERIGSQVVLMDAPMDMPGSTTSLVKKQKRSGIIKEQSLKLAQYECEIDAYHKTFTAERTEKPYMEGHHSIPLYK